MYKLSDRVTVRDDVTMISIDNVSDNKSVMGDILNQIMSMDMEVDILDYHNNYKGSKLTVLVENSGILRVMSAVGMFKERSDGILCDIYCLNTSVTVSLGGSPLGGAAKIIKKFAENNIEIYHLFSGICGITVVINEAYTDKACDLLLGLDNVDE